MPGGDHKVAGPGGNELAATTSKAGERRKASTSRETLGHLYEGGWHVVSIKGGDEEGGITSHRGVLHPDEYVDPELLQLMVERRLGFSYEQVRSVYRQGPLSADQRELRARIDARLLALSRSGSNLAELARAIGLNVRPEGDCPAFKAALARAKEAV